MCTTASHDVAGRAVWPADPGASAMAAPSSTAVAHGAADRRAQTWPCIVPWGGGAHPVSSHRRQHSDGVDEQDPRRRRRQDVRLPRRSRPRRRRVRLHDPPPRPHVGTDVARGGSISARFVAPVYDGETVDVVATGGPDGLELTVTGPDGSVRATGSATLGARAGRSPGTGRGRPARRPAAGVVRLAASRHGARRGRRRVLRRAGEPLPRRHRRDAPALPAERIAHPGWLLRFANTVLRRNVELGPWIHVVVRRRPRRRRRGRPGRRDPGRRRRRARARRPPVRHARRRHRRRWPVRAAGHAHGDPRHDAADSQRFPITAVAFGR